MKKYTALRPDIFALIIATVLQCACKRDKSTQPQPTPTPNPPDTVDTVTADLSGYIFSLDVVVFTGDTAAHPPIARRVFAWFFTTPATELPFVNGNYTGTPSTVIDSLLYIDSLHDKKFSIPVVGTGFYRSATVLSDSFRIGDVYRVAGGDSIPSFSFTDTLPYPSMPYFHYDTLTRTTANTFPFPVNTDSASIVLISDNGGGSDTFQYSVPNIPGQTALRIPYGGLGNYLPQGGSVVVAVSLIQRRSIIVAGKRFRYEKILRAAHNNCWLPPL